jgi:DNA primase large subunit
LRGTKGKNVSIIEDVSINEEDLIGLDINVENAPLCVKKAVAPLEPPHQWRWYFSVWMSWKGYSKKEIHAFIKRLNKQGLWIDYDFDTTNTQLNQIIKGVSGLTHYTCPDCKVVKGLGLCNNYDKKGLCSLAHPLQVTVKGQKDAEDMF